MKNTKSAKAKVRQTPKNKPAAKSRGSKTPSRARAFMLPLFLSFCILICLVAIGFLGYQTVTASDFFHVAKIDVRGAERSSSGDIRRIVEMQTEKSGVWNADLPGLKEKLEKVQFVKSASVSRVLPDGIRVHVFEKVPQAIVKTSEGNMLIDADGFVIAPAKEAEPTLPFMMMGWNEQKSEAAGKENVERVKLYQKMLSEWTEFNLSSRVLAVDLSDVREPRAVIEDSGTQVSIALGREKFGDYLKRGINAIVGKGETFEAVNLVGTNMILAPRKK
ncbi:MAG TPA: FtsQ-type POTRA domain-containing protein [Pyrinomonadaceae bacterium]|nr:FtsQ-type POTRA domain-containing protein [Pyrinomonadaceae bacterium]